MTFEQVLAFGIFAAIAAWTPGPSNVMLTATGANAGVVRGLPCLFGVTMGMGLMMFIVAFGFGSVALEQPRILSALKWFGAAFLLWLSWRIATAGRSDAGGSRKPVGFVAAAAFQWVNPKSWLVCVSAVGTYLQAEAGSAFIQAASFGALFVLAAMPGCFVWLAFGAGVQHLLPTQRALQAFNIAMGALLAGSVIFFIA